MKLNDFTNEFWQHVILAIIFAFLLFMLTSCATEPKSFAAPRPQMAWDGKHSEAGLWTEYALQAVGASKLPEASPKDVALWCPKYAKLSKDDRIVFWSALMSKMAEFESGYKNSSTYVESFKDAHGKRVISRGLLQISQESANGYGCNVKDAKTLHEARVNLSCAAKIFERWVLRDGVVASGQGVISKGIARYWSVMRETSKSKAKIKSYLSVYPVCKS